MYYLIGFILGCFLIKAYRDYGRKPSCTLIVYCLVLATDILVGCSIIAWKCSISQSDEECELAVGGTVGSVVIWLLIMLVCPCFATCVEICVTLDNCKKKCIQYKDKLRPRGSCDIVIQKEAQDSITTALLNKCKASPIDQSSKFHVFNETGRAIHHSTMLAHETDRAKHHKTTFDGARKQTYAIKHFQQDVP